MQIGASFPFKEHCSPSDGCHTVHPGLCHAFAVSCPAVTPTQHSQSILRPYHEPGLVLRLYHEPGLVQGAEALHELDSVPALN